MSYIRIRACNWKNGSALLICQCYLLLLVYRFTTVDSNKAQDPQDQGLPSTNKALAQNSQQDILQTILKRARSISALCDEDHQRNALGADKRIANKFYFNMRIRAASKTRLVMPEKNLIWCMVPKAASTAIASAIVQANNQTSKLKDPSQPQNFLRKFYFYKNSLEQTSTAKYKSFYITRHPFSRLVAAYRDKLENCSVPDGPYFYETYGKRIVKVFRKAKDKTSQRKEPTFKEFVQYLLKEDRQNYDQHWKPITSLCDICLHSYEFPIQFETFSAEFDAFLSFLKTQKNLPDSFHIKATNKEIPTKEQRDAVTKKYMRQLPQSYIKKLHVVYSLDFKYFNYNLTEFL